MDFYESKFDALLIVCRVLIPEYYPEVIPLSSSLGCFRELKSKGM